MMPPMMPPTRVPTPGTTEPMAGARCCAAPGASGAANQAAGGAASVLANAVAVVAESLGDVQCVQCNANGPHHAPGLGQQFAAGADGAVVQQLCRVFGSLRARSAAAAGRAGSAHFGFGFDAGGVAWVIGWHVGHHIDDALATQAGHLGLRRQSLSGEAVGDGIARQAAIQVVGLLQVQSAGEPGGGVLTPGTTLMPCDSSSVLSGPVGPPWLVHALWVNPSVFPG